jgi:hypothetical protein
VTQFIAERKIMNENNTPENGNEYGHNPYYSDVPEYMNNGNTTDYSSNTNYYSSNLNDNGNYYNNGNMGAPMPQQNKKGFAIASMVLGIVSIFTCCLTITHFILAIIAFVLGIASLVSKKRGGTGMAVAGVATSSVSIVLSLIIAFSAGRIVFEFGGFYRDLIKTEVNEKEVAEEYIKTGELPDYLKKYDEGEWGDVFDYMYDGGFEEYFYENFVEDYDDHHYYDKHSTNDNYDFFNNFDDSIY